MADTDRDRRRWYRNREEDYGGGEHGPSARVTAAHSNKELAEPDFKGFGHHPLQTYCDNTGGEPLPWMLRRGSAGSNTATDHVAIVALPPMSRRRLMVTVDGASASHDLIAYLDKLARRPGHQLIYSVG